MPSAASSRHDPLARWLCVLAVACGTAPSAPDAPAPVADVAASPTAPAADPPTTDVAPAPPTPVADPREAAPPVADGAPSPTASPATAEPPVAPSRVDPPPASAPSCAEVHIGLDLRALPTNAGIGGIDLFVAGEARDLRRVVRDDPQPRIFITSGVGSLIARFDAATATVALARCKQAVAAYLLDAPRLPILMTSAAHVITPCRPCTH